MPVTLYKLIQPSLRITSARKSVALVLAKPGLMTINAFNVAP
jgi:hypothetical protein